MATEHATIGKYISRHSVHGHWPLHGSYVAQPVDIVVVIPALAEYDHIFNTLAALCCNSPEVLAKTAVIVVVNNGPVSSTPGEILEDNRRTLERIRRSENKGEYAPLTLFWVDVTSPDFCLPGGAGVGLARKIGLDHGLRLLCENNAIHMPLVCMDADAAPSENFLDAVYEFYIQETKWAGYAAYLHPLPDDQPIRKGIVAYELYMRYHEESLRWAGSPYAFPALGSIISCTASAYAAVHGMNRRNAGEDFYFMQQLCKTGALSPIPRALIYPSSRISNRTPFGTGQSISGYALAVSGTLHLPHPACYEILREFLSVVQENIQGCSQVLLDRAYTIHPLLKEFLVERHFVKIWDQLTHHYKNPQRRIEQFHVWFDGLRTIQLLHRLRDTAFPNTEACDAALSLLTKIAPDFVRQFQKPVNMSENDIVESVLLQFRRLHLARHALRPRNNR